MISVDQALASLLENAQPVCDTEIIAIENALSRILAEPVISPAHVPPADNSSMDGYAVKSSDIETGVAYEISQRITAGLAPTSLIAGTAARIFTGAEIPQGADAVIIQEDSEAQGNRVVFSSLPKERDNIRNKGQDVLKDSEILAAGARLRPQEVGLIASCGIQHVRVYKPLKVALVSTGDELVEPGKALQPGQIYNSNRYLIQAFCQQLGFQFIDLGTVADNLESTKDRLQQAANQADIVITTGGVSVGEEDHVKAAVEQLGRLNLWKVAIKPGKPLAFGNIGETDFIGLPGNPSSVFTTFLVLALPRLKSIQGLKTLHFTANEKYPALFSRTKVSRREYLRARRTEDGLEIFPNQSSGVLSSACWGDGFAIQREQTEVQQGQLIEYIPYTSLF